MLVNTSKHHTCPTDYFIYNILNFTKNLSLLLYEKAITAKLFGFTKV